VSRLSRKSHISQPYRIQRFVRDFFLIIGHRFVLPFFVRLTILHKLYKDRFLSMYCAGYGLKHTMTANLTEQLNVTLCVSVWMVRVWRRGKNKTITGCVSGDDRQCNEWSRWIINTLFCLVQQPMTVTCHGA
jgi:hypothetical protein